MLLQKLNILSSTSLNRRAFRHSSQDYTHSHLNFPTAIMRFTAAVAAMLLGVALAAPYTPPVDNADGAYLVRFDARGEPVTEKLNLEQRAPTPGITAADSPISKRQNFPGNPGPSCTDRDIPQVRYRTHPLISFEVDERTDMLNSSGRYLRQRAIVPRELARSQQRQRMGQQRRRLLLPQRRHAACDLLLQSRHHRGQRRRDRYVQRRHGRGLRSLAQRLRLHQRLEQDILAHDVGRVDLRQSRWHQASSRLRRWSTSRRSGGFHGLVGVRCEDSLLQCPARPRNRYLSSCSMISYMSCWRTSVFNIHTHSFSIQ